MIRLPTNFEHDFIGIECSHGEVHIEIVTQHRDVLREGYGDSIAANDSTAVRAFVILDRASAVALHALLGDFMARPS